MLSIVCVYNNDKILRDVLLKSLENQTAEYELITLDNAANRFKSAAEALNYGGLKAKGDYIVFVHQDMWFYSSTWLEEAERLVASIPDLGIAGVAGMSEEGESRDEKRKWSIEVFDEIYEAIGPVQKPEEVQTLDECVLLVPTPVFDKLKFDAKTFNGWHSYGEDYCLSVKQLGLRAYVIPAGLCVHACRRANRADLLKYQKRVLKKHKKNFRQIYSWQFGISRLYFRLRSLEILFERIFARFLPNVADFLNRELSECDTLLDLGCGYHSSLANSNILSSIGFSVGVEIFKPYLLQSKRKFMHSQYIWADVRRLEFKPKSFDAVVALELLEHLTREEGDELINKMQIWARKKVVIVTSNGYTHRDVYDGNQFQEHKSGWTVDELKRFSFKVSGLGGLKILREPSWRIKYLPKSLWKILDALSQLWKMLHALSQLMARSYPRLAFHLLATKQIDDVG